MPLASFRLEESDSSLADLCRAVEARLSSRSELAGSVLPVCLVPNLDWHPDAQRWEIMRLSPAVYDLERRTIFVNASTFHLIPSGSGPGVLAHEVAHALKHQRPAVLPIEGAPAGTHECAWADMLACYWGFHKELRLERERSYDGEYCRALDGWDDAPTFYESANAWQQKRALRRMLGK